MNRKDAYAVWIGTYGDRTEESVQLFEFDAREGALRKKAGFSGIACPSFLALSPGGDRLYAVSETAENGHVVSLRADAGAGGAAELNRRPSEGGAPCHLTVDDAGRWALLANYMDGSLCVYPIEPDGSLGPRAERVQHAGGGPNRERQEGPHAHSVYVMPGTDYVLAADLGTDTVYVYRLDRTSGRLAAHGETKLAPGSGPRHLGLHPTLPVVYAIGELDSTVTALEWDRAAGTLTPVQTISTLPDGEAGPENACAEVTVSEDGLYVYGSNRGDDSIVTFRADRHGRLTRIGLSPTGGCWPRHFALVPGGQWLLAANERSDTVVVMKIGPDGVPVSSGVAASVRAPSCVKVI